MPLLPLLLRDALRRARLVGLAAAAALAAPLGASLAAQAAPPLPGTITEHVHWSGDPKHGFSVYMPSRPLRPRTPLLIILDPSGDAHDMLKEFAPAAEKLGWVIASAEESRSDNGDETPTVESATAIYNWASGAFPFDQRRVYLTGMSGTARICWVIWRDYRDNVAGIIGAAASIPAPYSDQIIAGDAGVSVALTSGDRDFNHAEVRALAVSVDSAGTPSRFASHAGPHGWPPAAELMRTMEWLEVRAMQTGRRAMDSTFARGVFTSELARGDSLAAEGDLDAAERAFRELARDARGWSVGDTARARSAALVARPELVAMRAALKPMLARELAQQDQINKVLSWEEARETPPSVDELLDRLGARPLLKEAAGADVARALSAKRQLARLRGMLGFYGPTMRERAGKPAHAARLREAGKQLVVP
jgi:dienelactone hydrolase